MAIIGAGNIAKSHVEAYKKMPDVRIKTIVDKELAQAKKLAKTIDSIASSSIDDVLNDSEIDAVDICLPSFLHMDTVIKFAQAKKNIICEKPIALSVEDARRMFEICESMGVMLCIAQVCRFMRPYEEIKKQLELQEIGEVKLVRMTRAVQYPVQIGQTWYQDINKSGGPFLDFIIHDLDFITWNFGRPEIAASYLITEDNLQGITLLLQIPKGPFIRLEGVWASTGYEELHQRLEMEGTKGSIIYDTRNHIPLAFEKSGGETQTFSQEQLSEEPFYKELRHFVNCFIQEAQPLVREDEVIQTLDLAIEARDRAVNLSK
jgi:UDP-N-acetylglucosamine 3-dehydrogenase